jgi:hypothetical protein
MPDASSSSSSSSSSTSSSSKGLPTLVEELVQLVLAYARQQTVDPLKTLLRFVMFGLAGSIVLGLGLVLLILSGLRALQTQTGSNFTGHLSWIPYAVAVAVGAALIGLAIVAAGRGPKKGQPLE